MSGVDSEVRASLLAVALLLASVVWMQSPGPRWGGLHPLWFLIAAILVLLGWWVTVRRRLPPPRRRL